MATMAATANKRHVRGAVAAPFRQAPLAGAFSVFVAMACAPAAHAIEWRFVPSVSASATYTDNVRQRENNPDNALVLTATPGFTLESRGSRRLQAKVQYDATGVVRLATEEGNDLHHYLNAVGKAELVEDFVFVDGSARVSQELISLFGSPADANINDENRATVGTYSISPYIQKRLGTFANVQLRYTNSGAIFENQTSGDIFADTFAASLTSGTRFDDVTWGLDYSTRKARNENDVDTTFERMAATAGFAVTRKFRVVASAGEDSNDYLSASKTGGSFYSVGFGWTPTRRTSIEASAGERYFGSTFSLAAQHSTRKTRWSLRYAEEVSDAAKLSVDFLGLIASCPSGVAPETDWTRADFEKAECRLASLYNASITRGIFISKLLTGGVTWAVGNQTDLAVTVSDLVREYQLGGQGEDRIQSVSASVNHRLSMRDAVRGALSFTRNSADSAATGGTERDDDIARLSVSFTRRYTADLSGALMFSHTERDSNVASADYTENALTASINLRF